MDEKIKEFFLAYAKKYDIDKTVEKICKAYKDKTSFTISKAVREQLRFGIEAGLYTFEIILKKECSPRFWKHLTNLYNSTVDIDFITGEIVNMPMFFVMSMPTYTELSKLPDFPDLVETIDILFDKKGIII